MVVMRSAFWAQGWWFAEDPVVSGLLRLSLEDFFLKGVFLVNLNLVMVLSREFVNLHVLCYDIACPLIKNTDQNPHHHNMNACHLLFLQSNLHFFPIHPHWEQLGVQCPAQGHWSM